MTNLKQFNQALRKATKNLPTEAVKIAQRKLAFDALTGIVRKTPIDTGRARGNWQVTINEFPEDPIDRKDKTKPGTPTINAGMGRLARVPNFAIIYITNNVPYIGFLEHGTSKQAAIGMIAVTMQALSVKPL